MGNALSSFKVRRQDKKELKRKQRLYRDFSASEREEIIKRKTQMEEQIKALEKRMYLEDQARDARRNRPKLRAKMAWLAEKNSQPAKKQWERADLFSKIPEAEGSVVKDIWRHGQWAQCPTCSHRVHLRDVARGTAV